MKLKKQAEQISKMNPFPAESRGDCSRGGVLIIIGIPYESDTPWPVWCSVVCNVVCARMPYRTVWLKLISSEIVAKHCAIQTYMVAERG